MKTTNKGLIISDKEFIDFYNEGMSQAEICKNTGISAAQASRRCKKLNLDPKKNTKANYNKIDIDRFLLLYNKRTSDAEIARQFNCSESKIKSFRESLKLKVVDRRHFTDEEFLSSYNLNYTDKQIAEVLNTTEEYVVSRRNNLDLPFNKKIIKTIPLTEIEFQVILGTVLGDTYLGKSHNNGNVFGSCAHCVEQEELIFNKYEYLKNISKQPYLQQMYDIRFKEPSYKRWFWYIYSNPTLTELYPLLYNNKIKYINEDLLFKIEPLGLAIWFMDDGSKEGTSGYLLCTNSFSNQDIDIIQRMLLFKFGINTSKQKGNSIYIMSDSKNAFKKLIEPYIVNSMKYKL